MHLGPPLIIVALAATTLAGCADDPTAPGFDGATGWIGSEPLDVKELRGQVVLVDFWTYSCVNCIRTLPHLTAWYEAYAEHGLVVVGVHTPEFEFEKDPKNVLDAMDRFGIDYPVAQDNDRGIWQAYNNRYWPAKYLIDQDGRVVYTHFGEGAYAETEGRIRALLVEGGAQLPPALEGAATGIRGNDITPELYAGTWRQSWTIGNPEGYRPGTSVDYALAAERARDRIYLDGVWFNGEEALVAQTDAVVSVKFRAGAANFVADGPQACVPVSFDGASISAARAGPSVESDRDPPCIELAETPRSYDFYAGPVETHEVRFDVPAGFALYTFAFSAYPGET